MFFSELEQGKLIKRYKRFFADIKLNERIETAHVPNTGSLKGCLKENAPCLLTRSDNPNRKLPLTLEAILSGNTWVGVNTQRPNELAEELFKEGQLPFWTGFDRMKKEIKINEETRIDMVLWETSVLNKEKVSFSDFTSLAKKDRSKVHFVEIKNVTLARAETAYFPDAETLRGQKHIDELCELIKMGFSAEILFIIQRNDCQCFRPAWTIDAVYAEKLQHAYQKGLKLTAIKFKITETGLFPEFPNLPIHLEKNDVVF